MSEKIKAAALSATKGLSRVQAERATANATRNVNAYGQKEEGPSRWQEKKEAKTQMYLTSTEKQATVNQKRCQKCRKMGHWTYECQKQAVEESSKLEMKFPLSYNSNGVVDVKKKDEKKSSKKKEKSSRGSKGRKKRRKHRSRSTSDSESSSDSESDGERRRKRKRHSRGF